jgi:hypothetical protein
MEGRTNPWSSKVLDSESCMSLEELLSFSLFFSTRRRILQLVELDKLWACRMDSLHNVI